MLNLFLMALPLLPSLFALLYVDVNAHYIIAMSTVIGIIGYFLTSLLVPVMAEYTGKRGLCGKDLGKKGTPQESRDVPEALGIVAGTTFLVCTIFSQLAFAKTDNQRVIFNSALFSICFMIFLGFLDDTVDLKWRYKLFLPTIASLPLLSTYSGSTAMYLPTAFRPLLFSNGNLTHLGKIVDLFVTVDTNASGAIIELGYFFLLFMGLQAVFCTNAINIYAGINGLECGQSYIIACSLLFFKLYELSYAAPGDNQLFAIIMIIPFIGSSLGLLRHNWFPADVFVGDTFCYFAGMTFAVIGIHSHFSKTLLLLFLPQTFNFLYSIPQLFKILPCPRHRLPRIDTKTGLMYYSAFPCEKSQYKLFKISNDAEECPNCTLICLVLRLTGPISERSLCITLLFLQAASSALAFYIRYSLLE
jgi:UDP-N-acetylglucosamine--dolichyl-phosphate N-acetylglucosaminephosphotransferase